jgi:HAE1 family hydrophobic/amphiphilic exporter-1
VSAKSSRSSIRAAAAPAGAGAGGGGSSTHVHFNFYSVPSDQRKRTQAQMIAEVRKRLAKYPASRPSVSARSALGSGEGQGGFAVSANILGPDLAQLSGYALKALEAAQQLPSLAEPKLSLSVSNPEIHVAVDRRRAADLGVRMATIGSTLRMAVSGDDRISFFKEGQEQYPIKLRVLETQRRNAEEIGRLTVPSASGRSGSTTSRGSSGASARPRCNDRTASSPSDDGRSRAGSRAGRGVGRRAPDARRPQDAARNGLPPPGTVAGARRDHGEHDPGDRLAMIFVYMVLAAQFESFMQPVDHHAGRADRRAVRAVHLVGDRPHAELWSALGMLLLLGIVKKNSILQVDYANTLRAAGMPVREAVIKACQTTLRPILMTTCAIIAGLVPTALGIGIGGTGRAAIAVTIIGGQRLCLFLTLLLTPVAYEQLIRPRRIAWRHPRESVARTSLGCDLGPAAADGDRREIGRVFGRSNGPCPPFG